jgi:hypothetical protein
MCRIEAEKEEIGPVRNKRNLAFLAKKVYDIHQ